MIDVELETFGPSFMISGEGEVDFPTYRFKTSYEADSESDLFQKLWIEVDRHRSYLSTILGAHIHFVGTLQSRESDSLPIDKSDASRIGNFSGKYNDQIEFKDSVGAPDSSVLDVLSKGQKESDKLLCKAPLESDIYVATSWYRKGIFSMNVLDTFLDFWRAMEILAMSQWRLEKNVLQKKVDEFVSSQLRGLNSDWIRQRSFALPAVEQLRSRECIAWALNRFDIEFAFEELCKFSDLRNKIAHGSTNLRDLQTVNENLPGLEGLARELVGAKTLMQYDAEILPNDEMEILKAYRDFVGRAYESNHAYVKITYDKA